MEKYPQTLVHRFWSHVFTRSTSPAVLVKNQGPSESFYVSGSGVRFGAPAVIKVTSPAMRALSYKDVGHIVAEFMAYLSDHGFKRGDRAAILSWNRPEWVWCDLAIQSLGGVTVPIYPNSSPQQASYIVRDAQCRFVFGENEEQLGALRPELLAGTATQGSDGTGTGTGTESGSDSGTDSGSDSGTDSGTDSGSDSGSGPEIPVIVPFSEVMKNVPDYTGATLKTPELNEPVAPLLLKFSKKSRHQFMAVLWRYVAATFQPSGMNRRRSGDAPGEPFLGVKGDDVATIIYTSGSTGVPKGAVLTHSNIASSCEALLRHGFDFSPSDVYLSYLPLAHVYERVNGQAMCIWNAVPVAFCRVDELAEALKLVQPTILCGVPAVWRKMKDKIESELKAQKGVKAHLITWALSATEPGLKRNIADRLVFSKIRSQLGGRLRLIMSGGAAISPEILSFFHTVGLDLRQGYGLTETTGGIAAETATSHRIGSVGRLIDTVEVKIVPEESGTASGVIWLRGKSIFKGYWHLPAENAKAFDQDGWFNTGDLGWLDEDGFLHITGRKKRQGKTDGGKYFSPEKIERAFDSSPIVQCIVPTGDGRPFIGALIFINPMEAQALLARVVVNGNETMSGVGVDEYSTHPAIVKAVQEAVDRANSQLEHWETIKQYEIVSSTASVDNGLLTATLKVRSEEVLKRYADLVEKIYSRKR